MADLGSPYGNFYEVALWEDVLKIQDDELFYVYMDYNQAIAIPDMSDAVRALTGLAATAEDSIARTNEALGIRAGLY